MMFGHGNLRDMVYILFGQRIDDYMMITISSKERTMLLLRVILLGAEFGS